MPLSFIEAKKIAETKIAELSKDPIKYSDFKNSLTSYKLENEIEKINYELPESLKVKTTTLSIDSITKEANEASIRKNLYVSKRKLNLQIDFMTILMVLHKYKQLELAVQEQEIQAFSTLLAAKRIARWYRQKLKKRKEERKMWAVSIILPQLLRYGLKKRELKRQKSAVLIYTYLQEISNGGVLMTLVHAYQLQIQNCQRIIRCFLHSKKSKLELRLIQVDKYEKKNVTRKRRKSMSATPKSSKAQVILDIMKSERLEGIQKLLFTEQDLIKYF